MLVFSVASLVIIPRFVIRSQFIIIRDVSFQIFVNASKKYVSSFEHIYIFF